MSLPDFTFFWLVVVQDQLWSSVTQHQQQSPPWSGDVDGFTRQKIARTLRALTFLQLPVLPTHKIV